MSQDNFDIIFCPPVDSSGDVYHIAVYMMLCRFFSLRIPHVYLFYDTDNTKMQAMRSKDFLKSLKFNDVTIQEIILKCHQAKNRLQKSTLFLLSKNQKAIDQKTTTSLISNLYLKYGDLITNQIQKYFINITMPLATIHSWIQVQLKDIKLKFSSNKFVVLHLRYSKKTNTEQNFSLEQLKKISMVLAEQKIDLIILDVGSNQGNDFAKRYNSVEYANAHVINVFSGITDLEKDHAKFPHISLLINLSRFKGFLGVIGNTSGSLDLVGFLGLNVLCIHRFKKESRKKIIIPAQDLRILLQSLIMSIYDYNCGLENLANFIREWLQTRSPILMHKLSAAEKIYLEQASFKTNHYDRNCFFLHNKAVFQSQYKQITCDQRLSEVRNKRFGRNNISFFLNSSNNLDLNITKHSQDDLCVKDNVPKIRRRFVSIR